MPDVVDVLRVLTIMMLEGVRRSARRGLLRLDWLERGKIWAEKWARRMVILVLDCDCWK